MTRLSTRLRISNITIVAVLAFFIATNSYFITPVSAANSLYFCKCMCFTNYTIIPLTNPEDVTKPCLSCTKQFCLDQRLKICKGAEKGEDDPDAGTGEDGDVSTKCFQRDSYKDEWIVYLYILLTMGLLIAAVVRPYATVWFNQLTNNRYTARYTSMPT